MHVAKGTKLQCESIRMGSAPLLSGSGSRITLTGAGPALLPPAAGAMPLPSDAGLHACTSQRSGDHGVCQ